MPKPETLRVLLVDDDHAFCRIFGNALADEGFRVSTAANGLEGLEEMNRQAFDLALVDLRMPKMDGLSLLAEMKRRHPQTLPVVLTGYGTVASAMEATRSGALDMVSKTASVEDVAKVLRRAAEQRQFSRPEAPLNEALFDREAFFGIIGKSPAMREVFRAIQRFQTANQPVLVCGESGTGKELVARAVHSGSARRDRPLIAVNCASLKENFVENELFGHVRGAYTGAAEAKQGLFSLANGGTLHIDEIAEMPASSQATLLRVLDSGVFRPLGGTEEIRVDVRIIAATNRDLEQMAANGAFRQDLFFRLCVCRIDLPPLRARREDIPLLVNHFLDTSANALRLKPRLQDEALSALMKHEWQGNVRELFNRLERAVLLADQGAITTHHLGLTTGAARPAAERQVPERDLTLEELERSYVETLLEREHGNVTEVSRILGVDATTVRRKLRRWGRNVPL
jgi:DNA-binding NtrC family response regulator